MANQAYSYDDGARREDLLALITNLDFKESQLFSGLGMSSARDISHQWLVDTLNTVGDNAYPEGADASYRNLTNPSRYVNYTQIIQKAYKVSDTERDNDTAGFEDRLSYEATKAMKEFKQDAEYAFMRGSLVCGNDSVPRKMQGIKGWLGSNNVTAQSGVSLTEKMFNDYLQSVWDDGTEVNAIYASMYIKRKIAQYTGSATEKKISADDRRLVNAVDVYQADSAQMVKLFAHRYVTVSGDLNYDLVGINEDMFKIAWKRKPAVKPMAKDGDNTKELLVGEVTMECYHKDAGFLTKAIL